METNPPITGSFLDGMPGDIPSQNWGAGEWRRQFDLFKEMGMDSLVIINGVTNEQAIYPTRVADVPLVYDDVPKGSADLAEFFFTLADERGLRIYMGLYDTYHHWYRNDWRSEVEACLPFIDEARARYGHHASFHGWYMSHEGDERYNMPKIWRPLMERLRTLDPDKPILISPRYAAEKYHGACVTGGAHPLTPAQHARYLDYMLSEVGGLVTAAAFMDGHCHFKDLKAFAEVTAETCARHHVEFWSNVETFDRDMPWRFPPIDWVKLRFKIETLRPFVSKMITFEAAHFLSPLSMFPSARCLYDRYVEHYLGRAVPPRLS